MVQNPVVHCNVCANEGKGLKEGNGAIGKKNFVEGFILFSKCITKWVEGSRDQVVVKGFSLCWHSGDVANINGGVSIGHVSVVGDYLLGVLVELVSVTTLTGLG